MMYCPSCGVAAGDGARFCSGCGATLTTPTPAPDPNARNPYAPPAAHRTARQPPYRRRADIPTNLTQAILATVFCCVPFGVVAIVYAAQVESRLKAGDERGARQASENAGRWSLFSFLACLAVVVLALLANLLK